MSYTNFTVETDADGIALVTWDMPGKSMNVFTEEVMNELDAIIDATVADSAVKGVVITSGKSSFSGGADLSMIKSMFTSTSRRSRKSRRRGTETLRSGRPHDRPVPQARNLAASPGFPPSTAPAWAAHSNCRSPATAASASNAKSVKIALPEVKVGIFPGAGGTQRVSRLTDAQSALQMMTTGQSLTRLARQGHEPRASGGRAGSADPGRQADDQGWPEAASPPGTRRASRCPAAASGRLRQPSSGRQRRRSCAAKHRAIIPARSPS